MARILDLAVASVRARLGANATNPVIRGIRVFSHAAERRAEPTVSYGQAPQQLLRLSEMDLNAMSLSDLKPNQAGAASRYESPTDAWSGSGKLSRRSIRSRRLLFEYKVGDEEGHYTTRGRTFGALGPFVPRRLSRYRNLLKEHDAALKHHAKRMQDANRRLEEELHSTLDKMGSLQMRFDIIETTLARLLRIATTQTDGPTRPIFSFTMWAVEAGKVAWRILRQNVASQLQHLRQSLEFSCFCAQQSLAVQLNLLKQAPLQTWQRLRLQLLAQAQSLRQRSQAWIYTAIPDRTDSAQKAYEHACIYYTVPRRHSALYYQHRKTFIFYQALNEKVEQFAGQVQMASVIPILAAAASRRRGVPLRGTMFHRGFANSASEASVRKTMSYRDLVKAHSELLERPFPMEEVLEDLRDLQGIRSTNRELSAWLIRARAYRATERRLFKIHHQSLQAGTRVMVREVTQQLAAEDSLAWTKIRERLLTGRVKELDDLSREMRAKLSFLRIFNIGPKKADKLVAQGYRSLQELHDAPLESAQGIGLRHLANIESLIPRDESLVWSEKLRALFEAVDARLQGELLGSFRRRDAFSSDLDWVLYHPDVEDLWIPRVDGSGRLVANPHAESFINAVITALESEGLLADKLLAHVPLAVKGLVRLGHDHKARRIDIIFAPYGRRAFYTLAKTGDTDLMVHFRAGAKARGMVLNEYGIGPSNDNGSAWRHSVLEAEDEATIFRFLNVDYLTPKERNFASYRARLDLSPTSRF